MRERNLSMNFLKLEGQGTFDKGSNHQTAASGAVKQRSGLVRGCLRLLKLDDGGPLLEFAFVLPMMMACLTGIFAFGVAIYSAINLTQATGQAAQYLQSVSATTADPCGDAMTAIENAAPTLKPSNITLSLSLNGGSTTTASSCASLASSFNGAANGSYFTVSTSYPCSILVYGVNLGGCHLASKNTYYIYNN
jgi:Flp pilus assembly protein TadG